MKRPWKNNFRKISNKKLLHVGKCDSNFVIAAGAKKITAEDILAGLCAHIGLTFEGGNINVPESQHPESVNGKFSKKNMEGWEIVRKDLPKITKTFYWESPNFGDPSKGWHMHSQERQVYPSCLLYTSPSPRDRG